MSHRPLKWIILLPLLVALAACSSNHVLVKKTDMEAANQCLLAQQERALTLEQQQQQITETLTLLQKAVELQQRDDSELRDFVNATREGREDSKKASDCSPRLTLPVPGSGATDKKVVGAKERVLLTDLGIALQSRVDTGATTSSLDAREIEIFERNGEEWVRFKIHDPDLDQLVELERPRSRKVRIIQSNGEDPERRPVVEMRITMGSLTQVAEFTLSDRSHMEFPLLIGRNVLRDVMLVDVARENITEPKPPKPSESDESSDE